MTPSLEMALVALCQQGLDAERVANRLGVSVLDVANALVRYVSVTTDEFSSAISLAEEIKSALEGDSNDAEHDALVSVAEYLGVEWDPDAASEF